ncbi:Uncharacterised protein [Salmonella enterica subsp. enterica serovar Bovismorbificans]|uniref:Uncharacterized protein n=1 Tax=Salmonella enterica subsp. enterica serovar Bovismorbificans TaxID=58097 RepID=A0A655BN31_SALET|nr:Uncharacterised protein [Salmonella enterica subsp. enterica serovar Bovismorbificans]CNT74990.1 Uncharacterised protein [Salmonella enterica subsp. enterica serovar Bovismorbificans]CNU27478.1 Uncharacterised protein [Salmonella enterica subsp. enterica serovar Bovismorbificans]CNU48745.1 Uncharacterised protein [Salmonella enterica subsp. enterica serovar Bovismorbificans]CPR46255.1 Uncharacterised protein [Salmonella enterica subsp. enterica serovar Bovismorbificans]
MLRNLVHLRNRLTDLNNTATLLIRGCRDIEHNIGDAFDGIHNLIHGAPRSDNLFRSLFNQADRCADQAFNLFCRLRAATGEGTNLTGDHRKTASLFPGACRLDRRVQRQNVGLESDTVNDGGNFRDFFRAGGNIPHRLYDPGNHLASATGFTGSIFRQFAGVMRIIRILFNGCRQLFHTGRSLFNGGSLLFSTRR